MKFGVREICDVVLKAKSTQKIGNRIFYKNEPVVYFDTLKTSSMEGAATTVYAQGGRGNSRLVAWEGERTVTFTMEDALISPAGFMILSGAGLVEADDQHKIKVHHTEQTDRVTVSSGSVEILLSEKPYFEGTKNNDYIYVMPLNARGEVFTEPYLAYVGTNNEVDEAGDKWESGGKFYKITVPTTTKRDHASYGADPVESSYTIDAAQVEKDFASGVVLVDYYVEESTGAFQIEITPDKFGGNYYLEASTLFRTTDGVDLAAEFVIPNCKIQSNFTFTMASSGDPSSFTFTMDAFPDYTRWDKTKKVLAAIQVVDHYGNEDIGRRIKTPADVENYLK